MALNADPVFSLKQFRHTNYSSVLRYCQVGTQPALANVLRHLLTNQQLPFVGVVNSFPVPNV